MATNLDQLNRFGPRDPVFSVGTREGGFDHESFGIYGNKDDAKSSREGERGYDIVEYWNLNEVLDLQASNKWRETSLEQVVGEMLH